MSKQKAVLSFEYQDDILPTRQWARPGFNQLCQAILHLHCNCGGLYAGNNQLAKLSAKGFKRSGDAIIPFPKSWNLFYVQAQLRHHAFTLLFVVSTFNPELPQCIQAQCELSSSLERTIDTYKAERSWSPSLDRAYYPNSRRVFSRCYTIRLIVQQRVLLR